jgi:hypothetical protein
MSTATSDFTPSGPSHARGPGRRRRSRAVSLATIAALTVLGPGAFTVSAVLDAQPAAAANKHKKKHHCKKGFVYQHGKCVARSRPVY